ncbi:MAG: CBS domain-containing protein [Candidatus Latescibacterota bacterium]
MQTARDILRQKGSEIISVPVTATLREALDLMVARKVGAAVVTDAGRLVGIWTERDLMRNVLQPGFDVSTARIGQHMVTGLRSAPCSDTVYALMDKFLGLRLRHLLVTDGEEYVGLLSIGDVIKACLQEKTRELEELNAAVSWEYYEEWRYRSR